MSSVVELLTRLGGVARYDQLARATSRGDVARAVAAGEVRVPARGRYVLAATDQARATAHEVSATLSHRSAALHLGWAVRSLPERPDVVVARNRRLTPDQLRRVVVHRGDLHVDDVVAGVTSRERTIVDCLRSLPGEEALAVADSALRAGESHRWMCALVRDARGPGSRQAREIASLATPLAANPFESALRWICLGVPHLHLEPQVTIRDPGWLGRPDLVDTDLRIVAEADSFEWHGGRADLARDARRYNALVVRVWLVLRFSWDDVMHRPDLVRQTVVAAVALRQGMQTDVPNAARPGLVLRG